MRLWHLRILSLGIALCLWYFVTTNVSTISLRVPIDVKGISSDKVLLSEIPDAAVVKLRGPTFLLSTLSSYPPVFKIKVPGEFRGKIVEELLPEDLAIPFSVEVLSIEPKGIELAFDERVERELPVEIPRLGTLQDGMKIVLNVNPLTVKLSGPKNILKGINRIETSPLDLREIKNQGKKMLILRKPTPKISLSEDSVEVSWQIMSNSPQVEEPQFKTQKKSPEK